MLKKTENRLLARAAQKRGHGLANIYRAATLRERTVQKTAVTSEGKYANRRRALQSAVDLLAEKEKLRRLTRELAKLDRRKEQRMAEEGLRVSTRPPY